MEIFRGDFRVLLFSVTFAFFCLAKMAVAFCVKLQRSQLIQNDINEVRSRGRRQARVMKREREIAKITGSTRSFSSASLKYLLFVFLSFYLHPDTRKKNCVNQFGYAKSTCVCMATRENTNSAFPYVRVSNPKHSQ